MFKLTIECATVAELQALVAQIGGTAVPTQPPPSTKGKTTSGDASKADAKPEPATTTPEAQRADGPDVDALLAQDPKALTSDQLREVIPVAGDLDDPTFGKLGIKFAKRLNDNGAKAKELFTKFKKADGGAVTKFTDVQAGERGQMVEELAEALAEAELGG